MYTPNDQLKSIGAKVKEIRLAQNLKRSTLSLKSGVSESSIKRFEQSGHISLKSLVQISHVLNITNWMRVLLEEKYISSLEEILNLKNKSKKRGVL